MSLQVDAGKYYYIQVLQANKKCRYYIGKMASNGRFEPFPKNIPLVVDYFMRRAFESLQAARLLESGRLPSKDAFRKQDFEEWRRCQKAPDDEEKDNRIARVISMLRGAGAVEVANEI